MAVDLEQVTFDCSDPLALAGFWSELLGGGGVDPVGEHMAMVTGHSPFPTLLFLRVPEGKTAKNRVHLDLGTADLAAETARLAALGATHVHDEEWGTWSTFLDPEGNEFCVGVEAAPAG